MVRITELQRFKDAGTQLVINYVAAYQWNSSEQVWGLVPDSSFNTDGSRVADSEGGGGGGGGGGLKQYSQLIFTI